MAYVTQVIESYCTIDYRITVLCINQNCDQHNFPMYFPIQLCTCFAYTQRRPTPNILPTANKNISRTFSRT